MHVWRLPLVYFAILVTTVALVALVSIIAALRVRTTSSVLRGILTSVGITGVIVSPGLVHIIADPELQELMKLGVYKHYGWPMFVAPALTAGLLLLICRALFPTGATSTVKWRVGFWAVSLAFAVLNLANWCSPGWCARFGFPFPYSWWSDAIIIMNGENLTAGLSAVGAALNLVVFLFVVSVMGRSFRSSLRNPPTPE